MTGGSRNNYPPRGFAAWVLAVILVIAGADLAMRAQQQKERRSVAKREQEYTRPKPTAPSKPTIPSANRYRPDKVFLEQADSLYRHGFDTVERQIVKGDVRFRQGAMWMFCDSAYYYPERNSMDAFGNVRMQQGDTLTVRADKLYYDGTRRFAQLYRGPSCAKVTLRDSRGELETDTLYYDVATEVGSYNTGGLLRDDVNTLSSIYGEYSPRTHDAFFEHDVELINRKDDYRLYSDRLRYNTATNIARIETPTRIFGRTDSIVTSSGWYNTANDSLELTSRSTVFHRDSLGRVTTLTGDSIVYDRRTRVSRVFGFADPARRGLMEINDTARKVIITGYEGYYNDSTREAYATIYPLLTEYSRPEPFFLRADTIYSCIISMADTIRPTLSPAAIPDSVASSAAASDSIASPAGPTPGSLASGSSPAVADSIVMREWHYARAYPRARFFNSEAQGVAVDSMVYLERDSMVWMHGRPVVWSGERQVSGPLITVHLNDSTADRADLPYGGLMAEHIEEDFFNQLSGKEMHAWLADRALRRLEVNKNVETVFLPQEEDSTYNRLVNAQGDSLVITMDAGQIERIKLWPQVSGTVTPIFLVKADQKFLRSFKWLDAIRPRREEDEEGNLKWGDDFGEISDELELYFSQPVGEDERPGRTNRPEMPE